MNEFINNLLLRIGFEDNLILNFNLSKEDFQNKLLKNIDPDNGLNIFEQFTSSDNDYIGSVGQHNFTLRRRRQLFDFNYGLTKFTGNYAQNTDTTIVSLKINIRPFFLFFIFLFLLVGYSIAFGSLLFSSTEEKLFILPTLLLHAMFMFSIFYFIFKYQIKRSKKNIERDLFFIMYK